MLMNARKTATKLVSKVIKKHGKLRFFYTCRAYHSILDDSNTMGSNLWKFLTIARWWNLKVSQWMKITIIFERFIVLMWKDLNFQLFCFCYSLLNVGSVFTEAQPGPTLTALCFEIAHSLLRNIVEREFQILTLMNFHEPLQIKCNFQRPSSSDLPLSIL